MVDVKLITDTVSFGITLDGVEYINTWEDDDILDWALNIKLVEYLHFQLN
jgi:hypothetical protein